VVDDIVTRLRDFGGEDSLGWEAADEIERLREESNRLLGVVERFAESNPAYDAFAAYFTILFARKSGG
jgi:hypothetical protein